jgi:hypothetical protein
MIFFTNLRVRFQEWRARRAQPDAVTNVADQIREHDLRDRLRRDLRDELRERRLRDQDRRKRW